MKAFRQTALPFLLVGASNSVVGFGVIWIALRTFGLGDAAANAAGYAAGFLWGFMLNRTWTFRHRGPVGTALRRYALVCGVAYAANLATVIWLSSRFGHGSLPAQACGIATYTTLAYAGMRIYAFPDDLRAAKD
ncbi:GtrA family protein [Cupriavidus basilensis]|uniref:GtrA family protein n=1 Tax=Cupriavidus basilensis TaxID=68895 RepID=A0ABT6AR65_9BURK|nr:GtrA family protein [Cupriavidus basilensis]MDF3835116.1 GtrA family protein [Cupriavidus basilensis]